MAFSEFTLESATRILGVSVREADLFPGLAQAEVPAWLPGWLARGTRLALISEKARSEFIVVPILLAARELCGDRVAIFSGQRLDVDPGRGLSGECDFLLALGPPVPPLRSPIAAVVEAKKNDVEAGLGQCIAQMVAARAFNEAAGCLGPFNSGASRPASRGSFCACWAMWPNSTTAGSTSTMWPACWVRSSPSSPWPRSMPFALPKVRRDEFLTWLPSADFSSSRRTSIEL